MKKIMIIIAFIAIALSTYCFTEVVGEQSGTWDLSGSPYHVIGDVYVVNGTTLIIEPEVEVLFHEDTALIVYGSIESIGNAIDQILFDTIAHEDKWMGIQIINTSSSTFQYCSISNSKNSGVKIDSSSDILIDECIINHNTSNDGGGINVFAGNNINISNCIIQYNSGNFDGSYMHGGSGIRCSGGDEEYCINIENNDISYNESYDYSGGGVSVDNCSNVIIHNNEIHDNHSNISGGGIAIKAGYDNVIDNNIIHSNVAEYDGGGIFLMTLCDITNNEIYNNECDNDGGGICIHLCNTDKIVDNNNIFSNVAHSVGGGMAIYSLHEDYYQHPNITNCKIYDNTVIYGNGGGLYLNANFSVFTNCEIYNNTATNMLGATSGNGGGIYIEGSWDNYGAGSSFVNTIIYNNTAQQFGGGIYFCNSVSFYPNYYNTFQKCTISQNHANVCGGGFYGDEYSRAEFGNTIFWDNTVNSLNNGDQGYIYSILIPCYVWIFRYDDVQNGILTLHGINTTNSNAIYFSNIIEDDPVFVDAPNQDFSLKWDFEAKSPCIDAGNPALTDDDGTPSDMGAITAITHKYDIIDLPYYQIDSGWKWLSFPALDIVLEGADIAGNVLYDILDPTILDIVEAETYDIEYDEGTELWQNDWRQFLRTEGFKFHMNEAASLEIIGFKLPDENMITLLGNSAPNWIGYWLEETQKVEDAFGQHWDEHNIKKIEAQHWCAVWWDAGEQWLVQVKDGFKPTLSYGEMVIIHCEETIEEFRWNNSTEEDERVTFAEPKHFTFEEQAAYTPLYVEINPMDPPVEIGAMVNGVCIGATVVEDTLIQISAYAAGVNPGDIELELYYGERAENKTLKSYKCVSVSESNMIKESISTSNMQSAYFITLREDSDLIPEVYEFSAVNYPNPFNPSTTIAYSIPEDGKVDITVYNIKGQRVKTLISGEQQAGAYKTIWNGDDNSGRQVSTGIYFYKLSAGKKTIIKKMLMLK